MHSRKPCKNRITGKKCVQNEKNDIMYWTLSQVYGIMVEKA